MKPTDLTLAQRNLLLDLPYKAAENYKPAKILVEKGLAEWQEVKYGKKLFATEAGREMIVAIKAGEANAT